MAKVVISEFMDDAAIDWLRARHDVRYDPKLVDDREALARACADAQALILRNRTRLDAALLDAAKDLRVVGRLGVGLDNIDLGACKARNIAVYPASGGNVISVAEYVVTAILVLRRKAWWGTDQVLAGEWPRQQMMGQEVSSAWIALVGLGTIAQAVAERAKALGMKIAAYDPFLPADSPVWEGITRYDSPEELVAEADAVSLHVPLTDQTRGLFGREMLARMKPGAILVNTARGGIVDEAALAQSLATGHLGGAAIDVFDNEPLPAGGVLVDAPNLIATPHIAGVTIESNTRISWITVQNVDKSLTAANGI